MFSGTALLPAILLMFAVPACTSRDEPPAPAEEESKAIEVSVGLPKHKDEPGPVYSSHPPPSWDHAEVEGPQQSTYVPPTYLHADNLGRDFSTYVPADYKHATVVGPQDSTWVPDHFRHADIAGPLQTFYVSKDEKHADVAGDDHSTYVPDDHKHADVLGQDHSLYVPGDWIHAEIPGPHQTTYVGPTDKHVEIAGQWHSVYVEKDHVHADKAGPDFTIYVPPTYIHAGIAQGVDPSRYVKPTYDHRKLYGNEHTYYASLGSDSAASVGSFEANDSFVHALHSDLDLSDRRAVFSFVFSKLDDEVTVFPTENYYYFRFTVGTRQIWGSLSLSAHNRDEGVLGFGYSEKDADPRPWRPGRIGGGANLTEEDGVTVARVSDFQYTVTFEGKTAVFNLNDPGIDAPVQARLASDEIYVGPAFDESGLAFHLVFNRTISRLFWVLNEDAFVPETFTAVGSKTRRGDRTGFVFYVDEQNKRLILVGVHGLNVLQNNWYDGPFDQLPDNYVKTGQIEIKHFLAAHYPGVADRIDEYGHYLDQEGVRVAFAPYRVYFEIEEMSYIPECEQRNRVSLLACLTEQVYEIPDEYE